jgi:plastocyanin
MQGTRVARLARIARALRPFLLGVGALLLASGMLPAQAAPARPLATQSISMINYQFSPTPRNVPVGTTVTWTNATTGTPHTTTSDTGAWDSGTVNAGGSFSFTFTTAGTFNYHCSFHQSLGMVGTINAVVGCPNWDVNCDHVANINDIVEIGQNWLQTGPPGWIRSDVNSDGVVNVNDVIVIGQNWLQTW